MTSTDARTLGTSAPARADRVPIRHILGLGATTLPLAMVLLTFGVYVPRFYVALGVKFAAVGATIALVRILDVCIDPLVGLAMDRTRTPIGRFRPWLLLGAPIFMLGVYRIFDPAGPVDSAYLLTWFLVAYVGNSFMTVAAATWGANVAQVYKERARLYGWTQAMGVVGSVSLLLLGVITAGKIVPGTLKGTPVVGLIMVVVAPVAVLVTCLLTPEHKLPGLTKPRFSVRDYLTALKRPSLARLIGADLLLSLGAGATGPMYIYFFHDAKGFSVRVTSTLLIFFVGAGLIGAPFWTALAQKISKHRAIQLACLSYAVCQAILMAIPAKLYLPTALGMASVGFCASAFIPLVRSMAADICDEARLETGQDLSSLLYSLVTTTLKVGTAISISIVLPILQFVGYNGGENVVNTPRAIFGLEMCYLFAPIILVFIGGASLFGYRLDAIRHAEIRTALEAREVAAAEEALVGLLPTPAAAE